MNVMVCVATTNSDHLREFLDNLNECAEYLCVELFVIENCDTLLSYHPGRWPNLTGMRWKVGSSKKRPYAQIMKEKIEFVSEVANDDSIIWFADVDYYCNPQALKAMETILEENREVDYLSLLRGPNTPEGDIKMSGWKFFRWPSMMGGSMMVRWSTFKNHAKRFFELYGTNGMFDQEFWSFLREEYHLDHQVYTISWPCSLLQHCRLGSVYGHDQGKMGHLHSINFDPRCNFFSFWLLS